MAPRVLQFRWRAARAFLPSPALTPCSRIACSHAFSTTRCIRDEKTDDSDVQPEPLPFPLDEPTFAKLRESLMQRKLPLLFDFVTSTPQHSLDVTLSDFLPWKNVKYEAGNLSLRPGFGKHLVYFPPQDPLSRLLPDATDPAQSPGSPFDRRMWAGGRIAQLKFPPEGTVSIFGAKSIPFYDSLKERQKAAQRIKNQSVCLERIADVKLKGSGDTQKIFVTLERRIGLRVPRSENAKSHEELHEAQRLRLLERVSNCDVIERRDLVFMTHRKSDAPKGEQAAKSKVVRAPAEPEFSVTLTPTQDLLFRFSALTFNAHRIHLDKSYCRDVEGHRNLLVHGPMSCVLMIEALNEQLRNLGVNGISYAIQDFTYRNLAPLYAEEPLKVCVRRKPQDLVLNQEKVFAQTLRRDAMENPSDRGSLLEVEEMFTPADADADKAAGGSRFAQFECWVENSEGGLSVRGTAVVEMYKLRTKRE